MMKTKHLEALIEEGINQCRKRRMNEKVNQDGFLGVWHTISACLQKFKQTNNVAINFSNIRSIFTSACETTKVDVVKMIMKEIQEKSSEFILQASISKEKQTATDADQVFNGILHKFLRHGLQAEMVQRNDADSIFRSQFKVKGGQFKIHDLATQLKHKYITWGLELTISV